MFCSWVVLATHGSNVIKQSKLSIQEESPKIMGREYCQSKQYTAYAPLGMSYANADYEWWKFIIFQIDRIVSD